MLVASQIYSEDCLGSKLCCKCQWKQHKKMLEANNVHLITRVAKNTTTSMQGVNFHLQYWYSSTHRQDSGQWYSLLLTKLTLAYGSVSTSKHSLLTFHSAITRGNTSSGLPRSTMSLLPRLRRLASRSARHSSRKLKRLTPTL